MTIKILAMEFTFAQARLRKKDGLHPVLLLSPWDQQITLCVVLTDDINRRIKQFLNDAAERPEAELVLPIHHQIANKKFHVF